MDLYLFFKDEGADFIGGEEKLLAASCKLLVFLIFIRRHFIKRAWLTANGLQLVAFLPRRGKTPPHRYKKIIHPY
jgi:hypothetical protein